MVFLASWLGVIAVFLMTDSFLIITSVVTIAALATEALLWTLAIIGGWTLLANRQKLWSSWVSRKATREA